MAGNPSWRPARPRSGRAAALTRGAGGVAAAALAGVTALASPAGAAAGAPRAPAGPAPAPCPVRAVNVLTISAMTFSTDCLAVPAGRPTVVVMVNNDLSISHDFDVWRRNFLRYGNNPQVFGGRSLIGGQAAIYEIPALPPGRYFFDCSYHVSSPSRGMHGTFWVVRTHSQARYQ